MDFNYFAAATHPYSFLPTNSVLPSPSTNNASTGQGEFDRDSPEYEPYPSFSYGGPEIVALEAKTPSVDIVELGRHDSLVDLEGDLRHTTRSSSEEKDNLTPAQSRRKAQNRAAQRAFRERKERHVKDLEDKLDSLQNTSNGLLSENQRLKREIHRIATENTILKATKIQPASLDLSVTHVNYNPQEFYRDVLSAQVDKVPSPHVMVNSKTSTRTVGAGAAWDIIQEHPLFQQGLLDLAVVCQRLKVKAGCDLQGPVFAEADVRDAIEASASASNDELI